MPERSRAEEILSGLKDFQRATVDYVHDRLWDADGTRKFLVADEVGLGKTMVARGVIARAVEHLTDTGDPRIDVVYICSNSQIARQNLGRLNVVGGQDIEHADRLTMLPAVLRDLDAGPINFISFTPGTSFTVAGSGGKAKERALLYWLLAACWGRDAVRSRAWTRFFAGGSGLERFTQQLKNFDRKSLDDAFVRSFAEVVDNARSEDGVPIRDALEECVSQFRYLRRKPDTSLSQRRYRLIGTIRKLVARSAVEALHPDLVILDEFQRFKDLLAEDTPGSELAQALMDHSSTRVLLLSATPYKMYTLPDEPDGEDHHRDFVATYRFLAGSAAADEMEELLRVQRDALVDLRSELDGKWACAEIQARLRRVMCRTERTTAADGDDGMVQERELSPLRLATEDLRGWLSASRVGSLLDSPDLLEYWRSTPYLLNLLDRRHYKLKRDLVARSGETDAELAAAVREASGLLRRDDVVRYGELDPGNGKMRALMEDVIERGAWRLPWIAPSLPTWTLSGSFADEDRRGFTKRLVFSAWTVVPKAIGVVLSYEAERRLLAAGGRNQRRYDDRRRTPLLTFASTGGRLTGMPVFGLLYPSPALARVGDPLRIAREEGETLPLERDWLLARVTEEIQFLLDALPKPEPTGDAPDQSWYWAAPLLLDGDVGGQHDFLSRCVADSREMTDDGTSRPADHVAAARNFDPRELGRMPADLAETLALIALAGPGTAALRALSRVCGGEQMVSDPVLRRQAWRVAGGLRTLFNRPEIIAMLRPEETTGVYWRNVLNTCLTGCLSATLDEYAHVLVESEGLQSAGPGDRAEGIARTVEDALTVRAVPNSVDELQTEGEQVRVEPHTMRVHLAQRFGRDETEDNTVQRESHLRAAFNSPFWPFVLASTSVGQEGLDFHTYSHAVVHWNLPSNPIDLEQREGRVHRYKGHAVRKNVAATYGRQLSLSNPDSWQELFELAAADRAPGQDDLVPYWVFAPEGGAKIERYVPIMPLSREVAKQRRLLRTLGAYRLVLGQPRQDDLLAYVGDGVERSWARIDLRPGEE